MPLLLEYSNQAMRYAVWQITENSSFFERALPSVFLVENEEYAAITNQVRKLEWLAGRFLWYKMTGEPTNFRVEKNDVGKPSSPDSLLFHSISHSGAFVAWIEAATPCGIDIQVPKSTIDRIAHRIMHESDWHELQTYNQNEQHNENAPTLEASLFWSAKESVFKAWGVGGLAGKNIRLSRFLPANKACASIFSEEKIIENYSIFYTKNYDFTLTIALKQDNSPKI